MRKKVSFKFPNESTFIVAELNLTELVFDKVFDEFVFAWYHGDYLTLIKKELIDEGIIFK